MRHLKFILIIVALLICLFILFLLRSNRFGFSNIKFVPSTESSAYKGMDIVLFKGKFVSFDSKERTVKLSNGKSFRILLSVVTTLSGRFNSERQVTIPIFVEGDTVRSNIQLNTKNNPSVEVFQAELTKQGLRPGSTITFYIAKNTNGLEQYSRKVTEAEKWFMPFAAQYYSDNRWKIRLLDQGYQTNDLIILPIQWSFSD